MSERVAIVVGAGGELGRSTAVALASAGYTVVGVDRNSKGLEELPDGIRREVGDGTDPAARAWRPTASARRRSVTSSASSTWSCARRASGSTRSRRS
jgi:NAD(P)-dependent dehydrogenase (short-subunit alcohol dehydrogenase family)